jgi:hypothetical protein
LLKRGLLRGNLCVGQCLLSAGRIAFSLSFFQISAGNQISAVQLMRSIQCLLRLGKPAIVLPEIRLGCLEGRCNLLHALQ